MDREIASVAGLILGQVMAKSEYNNGISNFSAWHVKELYVNQAGKFTCCLGERRHLAGIPPSCSEDKRELAAWYLIDPFIW